MWVACGIPFGCPSILLSRRPALSVLTKRSKRKRACKGGLIETLGFGFHFGHAKTTR